ncbi:MAG TPA: NAD-dependent epimerase/dehydratase family protein [Blastocatellia bacterium]|nr:NAD-dependent epimerase/dehydratase family protein [Blastocatellia bacterium]
MTRILITGGAGFIGSHLVDRLIARGDRVTVIDNFDRFYDPEIKRANVTGHLDNARFELVEADIRDERAVNDAFTHGRFECVVHLAARAGVRPSLEQPLDYASTNVTGTYVLLEAAKRFGVRQFIFGSSSSVYGATSKVPFSEDDPLAGPISPYAATKIAGEAACHAYCHLYGIRTMCLRFFTVYGPRQRPDLAIHKFARLMTSGKPIPVYGDGTSRRDYTYIDDIVDGVLAAIRYEGGNYDVINLGESHTIDLRGLVSLLETSLGVNATIDWQPSQPGDVPGTFADISKARRLIGYDPQFSIESGIAEFVKWFRGRLNPGGSQL